MQTTRLSDVAKAAGVSQGTASNVFNRPDIVRKEVRERVEAAARALGYAGPDPKGRLLRAGKVNSVGVATAEPLSYFFEDPFARTLMASISAACDVHGAGISLVSSVNEEKLAWNIQSALVDGFILLCVYGGDELVALTRERRLPFVALELSSDDETISAIGIDDFAAARTAARHLATLGHRRFGVLSLELFDRLAGRVRDEHVEQAIYLGTRRRLEGYRAALEEVGIDWGSVDILDTLNDRETGEAALEALFASDAPPTAILAMSDRLALIALDWLRDKGFAVPGDVSVIGIDGVPEGEHSDPPLTTMAQPIAEIGRRAVALIFAGTTTPRRQLVEAEFVLRASTAPPPAG